MPATLAEIVAATRERLAHAKRLNDIEQLAAVAERHKCRGFRKGLERADHGAGAIIAELKKASPSRGTIRANFWVGRLASELEVAGAAALSVLTEERFFYGSLRNLREASNATQLPCLRKDFILDSFQIYEAKVHHADAVLLIMAALSDSEFARLHQLALALGLDAVCEVHNGEELQRALDLGAQIIGVNNRDLRTFEVDLNTALGLSGRIPPTVFKVAESGIQSGDDIRKLRDAGYQGFLIGELLMRAPWPGKKLRQLIADAEVRVERKVSSP